MSASPWRQRRAEGSRCSGRLCGVRGGVGWGGEAHSIAVEWRLGISYLLTMAAVRGPVRAAAKKVVSQYACCNTRRSGGLHPAACCCLAGPVTLRQASPC